jgi:hypothetical protein
MSRPRNSIWGRDALPAHLQPVLPTQFELECLRHGTFTLEDQRHHPKMKLWVKRYWRTRYIPEELLEAMNLDTKEIEGGV